MPTWQTIISDASAVALTVAFAGVTALGVLLAGELMAIGLQGVELPAIGGGLLAGVASAVAGRASFAAGIGLDTGDLANLMLAYLVIGTLFAMVTATDPRWWEQNFSQLGIGAGSWAFNGTLVVAGLLIATVGSYIGRDLHRVLGDAALGQIGWVVLLWAATGAALACVGLFPIHRLLIAHNLSAFAALVLFIAAAVVTTLVIPGRPQPLLLTTLAVGVLVVIAVLLCFVLHVYSVTVLEAIVIGLGLLWMTTLVRVLAVLTPEQSRPSMRARLLRR